MRLRHWLLLSGLFLILAAQIVAIIQRPRMPVQSGIRTARIAGESPRHVAIDVEYDHAGDLGEEAQLYVIPLYRGEPTHQTTYAHAPAPKGRHTVRVVAFVRDAKESFVSDEVRIGLRSAPGAREYEKTIRHVKVWLN